MKIYVITPVGPKWNEEHLEACMQSVNAQEGGHEVVHQLVFDGPEDFTHHQVDPDAIILPYCANDIGSTPRTVGVAYAWGQGAEAVAFLDADCQYLPNHLDRLVRYQEDTQKPIVCSGRYVTNYDGSEREVCPEIKPEAEPPFHDTNTFLFTRGAIGISYAFGTLTGREEHKIGDRILTKRAEAHLACHYHPTVLYRSIHECHYHQFRWKRPEGVTLKNLSRPG